MAKHTNEDIERLTELNVTIGEHETAADEKAVQFFEDLLAPIFAFKRIDKIQKRKDFFENLKPGSPRTTLVKEVMIFGDRAVVTCVVTMNGQNYHNIRLFYLEEPSGRGAGPTYGWKLLGWANGHAAQV
jgi:hypothetical protein